MQELVNLNSFILLFTFIVNAGLGIFIYFRNRHNQVNRSFAALLFCLAIWTLCFLVFQNIRSVQWVLIARRFTPVGSSLLAGYFLFFSLIFPQENKQLSLTTKLVVLVPGFIFSAISVFSSLMIRHIIVDSETLPFLGQVVFGPAYAWFSIYFLLYFCLGLLILLLKYLKSTGKERLQIFYVLFGIFLAGLLGITFSLILPLLGSSQFFTTGPPFTLILAAFVTYAMVKHRLLNVDDFLSRGILVLALVLLIVGTVALLIANNIGFLLTFYTILAELGLGLYVYLKGRHNQANQFFCLLTVVLAAWGFCIYLSNMMLDFNQALLWNRMIFAVSALTPLMAMYFSLHFPFAIKKFSPWLYFVVSLPALFFMFSAVFTDWIVASIYFVLTGTKVIYGPLFPIFAFYLVSYLLHSFVYLATKYNKSHGIHRIQIRYLFFGSFLGSMLAILTNLLLPLLGNDQFTFLGPSFMLLMIGFITYAIVKHRLMSIEVVIQRSSVYAVAMVLIMAFYAIAVMVSETMLRSFMGYTSLFVTGAAALLIAIVYQPLIKSIQHLADRLFFRGRYDYQKTLKEISQKIASVIKLEELSRLIVSSFVDTMKISEISFMLQDKEREHFRSIPIALPRYKKIEIDIDSPIASWLEASKDILVRDEIEDEISRQESMGEVGKESRQGLVAVRDAMERLGIYVWVPIVSKDELIGIIALGEKLSGDIFTTEDIGLLGTLAHQTAVALDNARLYDEVVNMKDYNEEILQSMVSGVLTTDNRGRVVTFNYMAERITGRSSTEVLGKMCEKIWGKRGKITKAIEDSLRDRCYTSQEASIASPERGLVPVAFSSTILRDHQGKKIGALLNIRDLSEVKELEQKVRRADKLSALATMSAGMAHEIKNPLSSMKVLTQLLSRKFDDAEFRQKFSEIIPREINRIDRIVESLLGFARATAPNFEKMSINENLEDTIKYYKDQAKAAEVEIITNFATLPEIEFDKAQLSQVFSNLVLNAIQAMPSGGKLTISTLVGKQVEDQVLNIKIKVADTGHGMPDETAKKLFDPFFTTKYGGTGLGLTITHNIVDGHRGYIDVESRVGQGTTFTVTLPVSQGLI